HYDVSADFVGASNLGRYAEVRIAGRRVGQVLDVAPHARLARVRLQLNKDVRPLRSGTTARIRLKGLLGAKFVELTPSARGTVLQDGATLPATQTSSSVELFDVFAALDKRRRTHLRDLLLGLGTGFTGRGQQLNETLGELPPALRDLNSLAGAVNARGGAAERLMPSLDAAAGAFEPVRADLAAGWDPQARALAPFRDRRGKVQDALHVAPEALDAVRSGLHASDPLLIQTARFARASRALTVPAPAALRQTTGLLRASPGPLRTARTLLQRTSRAVPPTLQLTRRIDPLIRPLIRSLRGGLPVFAELDRRRCDLLGFVRNWRSMLAFGVPGSHPIGPVGGLRVTLVGGKGTAQQIVGGLPAAGTSDVGHYPAYCGLGQVTPLGGAK
ncbi:MAG: Virulence factor Mce family protein, partial [Solirubrobacterales bacterium]|nr:Virulence factor Mce family protein [Solirubrobacterales bacterium]